jgi:hypothetical protein
MKSALTIPGSQAEVWVKWQSWSMREHQAVYFLADGAEGVNNTEKKRWTLSPYSGRSRISPPGTVFSSTDRSPSVVMGLGHKPFYLPPDSDSHTPPK